MDTQTLTSVSLAWDAAWSVVPEKFPRDRWYSGIVSGADVTAAWAVERMTNDFSRDKAGQIHLLAPDQQNDDAGLEWVTKLMSRFSPFGGQFSDGTFGVFHAARDFDTALAEAIRSRETFLRTADVDSLEIDMREVITRIGGCFADAREYGPWETLDATNRKRWVRAVREQQLDGIVYRSALASQAECVAVFRPIAANAVTLSRHLCLGWNGRKMEYVYEKRPLSGDWHTRLSAAG